MTADLRREEIARLPLDGWSLDFEAIERWLVLSDPDGAAKIVAKDVDLEYGGDIAERWRRAGLYVAALVRSQDTATARTPDDWTPSPVAPDGTILDPGHYVVNTWACSCGFSNRGIPAVTRMHGLHHRTVNEVADTATARIAATVDPLYGTSDDDKEARRRVRDAMQRAAEKNTRGTVYVSDADVHSLLFELRSELLAVDSARAVLSGETR